MKFFAKNLFTISLFIVAFLFALVALSQSQLQPPSSCTGLTNSLPVFTVPPQRSASRSHINIINAIKYN